MPMFKPSTYTSKNTLKFAPHGQSFKRAPIRTVCNANPLNESDDVDAKAEAVLARIAAAREYKTNLPNAPTEAPSTQTQPSASSNTVATSQPLAANTGDKIVDRWLESTEGVRQQEEASFLQAQQALQEARASSPSAASTSAPQQPQAMLPTTPTVATQNTSAQTTPIAATQNVSAQTTPIAAAQNASAQTTVQQSAAAVSQQQASSSGIPEGAPEGPPQGPSVDVSRARGTGGGNADEAANFLKVVQDPAMKLDPNMRPEQFTIMKEELRKQQTVEIITVDQNYDAGLDSAYKPKVATWGVFPRPDNISKAFGGGRNLRPGQELETEEEKKASQERVTQALQRYKAQMGLQVDPESEAAAQRAYDEGTELFKQGKLEPALAQFVEASTLMNVRTKLGAQARLQQAITLDSLGRNQEAYAIYRTIERSNAPGVSKAAKRMLFGYSAAQFLKADKVTYAAKRDEWDPYFRKFQGWQNTYVKPEGEKEDLTLITVAAAAVMLSPVVLVGVKVLMK